MREAFLLSLKWHFTWYFEAWGSAGRSIVPLSMRRLLVLLIGFPLLLVFLGVQWAGLFLDEIFFRKYRKVLIKEPLFITGIPRSGTTFVHRTIATDTRTFTTFRTWEAIFAPSITAKKVVRGLARLDRAIGGPGRNLLKWMTRKTTGNFSHIHPVGLHAPEEDYLAMLPAAGCFILILAFPASPSLWLISRFHEMPDEERKVLLNYYKACLQKHLYCARPGQRLLSKNAAFGSWIPDLRFAFPDARYIICIRKPQEALSSQLSSLRPGLEFFGTLAGADMFSLQIQTAFAHVFRIILEEKKSFLVDRLAIIDQGDLRKDPEALLTRYLKQLGIDITPPIEDALKSASSGAENAGKAHKHQPLTSKAGPSEFGTLVSSIYEEILKNPHITRDDKHH